VLDAELDPGLRVARPNPYVYKSALKRAVARFLDFFGDFWLAAPRQEIHWARVKRVAVIRLDHLGDLLNAFPALEALRKRLPHAQLDLFVGPWSADLAKLSPVVDSIQVVQAPWFQRPERVEWPWRAILEFGRTLRKGNYDLAIELRGDLRHHLALAVSGIPQTLGHAVTAGRFLLTNPGHYDNALHEIDQNLSLLGAKAGDSVRLKLPTTASLEAKKVIASLKLGKSFVAIQAACGTPAKRWIPGRWSELIRSLPASTKLVLLGAKNELEEMQAIADQCGKRAVKIASGRLSLPALAAFLKEAKLLISVDSGPAHLAAAVGTPVVALYSGTNRVEQWGLRGKKIHILRAEVPCSPCERTHCPYTNECMRRIEVADVLAVLKTIL
jgi:ADP-heptose:LPS heptosyltransferase